MRKALPFVAVAATCLPSLGSAQVLADIESIVATVIGSTPTTGVFLGIAENYGAVDGSVSISVTGAAQVSQSVESLQDNSVTLDGGTVGAEFAGTGLPGLAGSGAISENVFGAPFVPGDYNCDVEAEGLAFAGACSGSLNTATLTDISQNSFVSVTGDGMISATFGNISTLAAGAVNDYTLTLDLSMNGLVNSSESTASTSNTLASSSSAIASSAALVGMTVAFNEADIDGSVTVAINAASGGTSGISTTAAGAINTGTIIVTVNDSGSSANP